MLRFWLQGWVLMIFSTILTTLWRDYWSAAAIPDWVLAVQEVPYIASVESCEEVKMQPRKWSMHHAPPLKADSNLLCLVDTSVISL